MDSSTLYIGSPISILGMSGYVIYIFLKKMVELCANSGDPDQMPHSVASDLGLHCLPVTLLGVSRLQWVKVTYDINRNISFITHWANSADDKLMLFSYFCQKIDFDIPCKLSPKETNNLHDMLKAILSEKFRKILTNVVCWNFYPACLAIS